MPIAITALPLALAIAAPPVWIVPNRTLAFDRTTGMLRRKMPCKAIAGTMPRI
jgi:hypothetical protein